MKNGTLAAVANTMAQDFTAAVVAAEAEAAAQIADRVSALDAAISMREDNMTRVRALRTEAGEKLAESLRLEEECERQFQDAMSGVQAGFTALQGEKQLARKQLRSIAGGKRAG